MIKVSDSTLKTVVQSVEAINKLPYQAPRIEAVLTPKEIERELFYAGTVGSTPTPVGPMQAPPPPPP